MNRNYNWIGLWTLTEKEITRFMSVYLQTIIAPVMTTILFYIVFAMAFAGAERQIFGMSFMTFLAPGLVIMAMVQNAFANTSSSLIISKMQGSINDLLIAPLTPLSLVAGYVLGAIVRGILIGVVSILALMFLLKLPIYSFSIIVIFSVLGCGVMGFLGLLGGIWADKFDHLAAMTNFIITPLTFLSGTFYSMKSLPIFWQDLAQFNPFFYMIDGFRYGFIGVGDSNLVQGSIILSAINIILFMICYVMIDKGYRIKS